MTRACGSWPIGDVLSSTTTISASIDRRSVSSHCARSGSFRVGTTIDTSTAGGTARMVNDDGRRRRSIRISSAVAEPIVVDASATWSYFVRDAQIHASQFSSDQVDLFANLPIEQR